MSDLTDRLRDTAYETDVCHEAAAVLEAIERYIVQLQQEGGPVCDTIARHLTELLHPEEGER